MEKYLEKNKLIKINNFVISKIIHRRALETLLFGFPENIKLFHHFRETFKKHYQDVGIIPEENDSSINSEKIKKKSDYVDENSSEKNNSCENEIKKFKNNLKKLCL